MQLPEYLFRGDSDPNNKRNLKSTLFNGLMMTNLCNGGSGKEIFNRPLQQSINAHVSIGWDKTHFLSFSESKDIALHYGCNDNNYEEIYDEKGDWDFALITFKTSLLDSNIRQVGHGIYSANFIPTCKEFLPLFKILLIDVVTHLESLNILNTDLRDAIFKAERDKEWLILPAYPFANSEFSSKLDTNCISAIDRFKFINY